MPPKQPPASAVDPADRRITRSRSQSQDDALVPPIQANSPVEPDLPDAHTSGDRPESRASGSSTGTVISNPGNSSPGVLEISDNTSASEDDTFNHGIRVTSTGYLNLPNPSTLPVRPGAVSFARPHPLSCQARGR